MSFTFAKDLLPDLLDECTKYMQESRWYNLEKLDLDLVRFWVPQLSLWTRTTFKMRGLVYAMCPYPDVRMAMLEVVGEEDIVDPRVGMNHRQLMATSLGEACGYTLEDLSNAKPLITTLVTFDILYGITARSWEEGLALTSGLERMLQQNGVFRREAQRLQRDLGWTDAQVAWFTGHDVADEDHGKVVEMLDRYITDEKTWECVRESILEGWVAWWNLYDGVLIAHRQNLKPVTGVSCRGLSTIF